MTEEIMIDGVNVAKCEFFDNGEVKNACLLGYREDAVNNFSPNCNDNTYCYYKQMQKLMKYKFVLEEINLILDELKQQYDYMTDYSEIKEIQNKINEVLNGN